MYSWEGEVLKARNGSGTNFPSPRKEQHVTECYSGWLLRQRWWTVGLHGSQPFTEGGFCLKKLGIVVWTLYELRVVGVFISGAVSGGSVRFYNTSIYWNSGFMLFYVRGLVHQNAVTVVWCFVIFLTEFLKRIELNISSCCQCPLNTCKASIVGTTLVCWRGVEWDRIVWRQTSEQRFTKWNVFLLCRQKLIAVLKH
jgi:hypothetical protein